MIGIGDLDSLEVLFWGQRAPAEQNTCRIMVARGSAVTRVSGLRCMILAQRTYEYQNFQAHGNLAGISFLFLYNFPYSRAIRQCITNLSCGSHQVRCLLVDRPQN